MWPKTPRSNIQSNSKILKAVNVNADFEEKTEKTDLRKLPNIEQDTERTKYIAEEIVSRLGDKHSQAFYYLVAAKIPKSEIWRALSEIKESKPQSPAAVFTSRMKNYATTQLAKKRLNSVYSSKKLAEQMSVR
jgi:N-glycosylase/DNA lyase